MSVPGQLRRSAACSTSGRTLPKLLPSSKVLRRSGRQQRRYHCAVTAPPKLATAEVVGVVVVDHGSRRTESNAMLDEFCQLYQQVSRHTIVEAAHMEIAEPTIQQAVGKCIDQGATSVVVAPYFLSKGRHIQQDIPQLVADARDAFPSVEILIAEPIGIDPLMARLIQSRVEAVLEGHVSVQALL